MDDRVKRLRPRGGVFSQLKPDEEKIMELRHKLLWPMMALLFLSLIGIPACLTFFKAQAAVYPKIQSSVEPDVYYGPMPEQGKSEGNEVPPRISGVFTPEVQHWSGEIAAWARAFKLDANLVATVMQIESCGHPEIESPSGALGLFQVMPFHFKEGKDGLDPQTNASRGLSYFRRSLELSGGDLRLAFAGYNGGHSVIDWDSSLWSGETDRYVRWGTGIMADIEQGLDESPTLQAWLNYGGASLCSQAAEALGLP